MSEENKEYKIDEQTRKRTELYKHCAVVLGELLHKLESEGFNGYDNIHSTVAELMVKNQKCIIKLGITKG